MKRGLMALAVLGVLAGLLWFGRQPEAVSDARPEVPAGADAATRGVAAFVGDDFGGLSLAAMETHAVPWKLVAAGLVHRARGADPARPVSVETLQQELARFGFLPNARAMNLPAGVEMGASPLPLGMTHGTLAPLAGAGIQVSNLGCAACHAGVTYDASGTAQPDAAWLGMPNTSINLEAYTLAVFEAMQAATATPDAVLPMIPVLFPETSWRERQVLRWLILPLVRQRLAELPDDRPLPFPNGVPGSTNGVAALKFLFDVPMLDGGAGETGMVSVPDLGHRTWRTSLLADGSYAIPEADRQTVSEAGDDTPERRQALAAITTFFTVPSMGVHPARALESVPEAEDIFAFLGDVYAPQPFPGSVDGALAAQGAEIYGANCASCHGSYDLVDGQARLQRFPNWRGDVGTDPKRAEVFSEALAARFADTVYRDTIAAAPTGEYGAPPLTGLWASAPYLHNGSVPTLMALLTPEARPATFELGGHGLDFEQLGIRLEGGLYPEGYTPFSDPVMLDTRQPGFRNTGHTFGGDLSAAEKRALIEFLKLL